MECPFCSEWVSDPNCHLPWQKDNVPYELVLSDELLSLKVTETKTVCFNVGPGFTQAVYLHNAATNESTKTEWRTICGVYHHFPMLLADNVGTDNVGRETLNGSNSMSNVQFKINEGLVWGMKPTSQCRFPKQVLSNAKKILPLQRCQKAPAEFAALGYARVTIDVDAYSRVSRRWLSRQLYLIPDVQCSVMTLGSIQGGFEYKCKSCTFETWWNESGMFLVVTAGSKEYAAHVLGRTLTCSRRHSWQLPDEFLEESQFTNVITYWKRVFEQSLGENWHRSAGDTTTDAAYRGNFVESSLPMELWPRGTDKASAREKTELFICKQIIPSELQALASELYNSEKFKPTVFEKTQWGLLREYASKVATFSLTSFLDGSHGGLAGTSESDIPAVTAVPELTLAPTKSSVYSVPPWEWSTSTLNACDPMYRTAVADVVCNPLFLERREFADITLDSGFLSWPETCNIPQCDDGLSTTFYPYLRKAEPLTLTDATMHVNRFRAFATIDSTAEDNYNKDYCFNAQRQRWLCLWLQGVGCKDLKNDMVVRSVVSMWPDSVFLHSFAWTTLYQVQAGRQAEKVPYSPATNTTSTGCATEQHSSHKDNASFKYPEKRGDASGTENAWTMIRGTEGLNTAMTLFSYFAFRLSIDKFTESIGDAAAARIGRREDDLLKRAVNFTACVKWTTDLVLSDTEDGLKGRDNAFCVVPIGQTIPDYIENNLKSMVINGYVRNVVPEPYVVPAIAQSEWIEFKPFAFDVKKDSKYGPFSELGFSGNARDQNGWSAECQSENLWLYHLYKRCNKDMKAKDKSTVYDLVKNFRLWKKNTGVCDATFEDRIAIEVMRCDQDMELFRYGMYNKATRECRGAAYSSVDIAFECYRSTEGVLYASPYELTVAASVGRCCDDTKKGAPVWKCDGAEVGKDEHFITCFEGCKDLLVVMSKYFDNGCEPAGNFGNVWLLSNRYAALNKSSNLNLTDEAAESFWSLMQVPVSDRKLTLEAIDTYCRKLGWAFKDTTNYKCYGFWHAAWPKSRTRWWEWNAHDMEMINTLPEIKYPEVQFPYEFACWRGASKLENWPGTECQTVAAQTGMQMHSYRYQSKDAVSETVQTYKYTFGGDECTVAELGRISTTVILRVTGSKQGIAVIESDIYEALRDDVGEQDASEMNFDSVKFLSHEKECLLVRKCTVRGLQTKGGLITWEDAYKNLNIGNDVLLDTQVSSDTNKDVRDVLALGAGTTAGVEESKFV